MSHIISYACEGKLYDIEFDRHYGEMEICKISCLDESHEEGKCDCAEKFNGFLDENADVRDKLYIHLEEVWIDWATSPD